MKEDDSTLADRYFNLQLMVAKYEEELQLYRNGMDVPQLLELMNEKDEEAKRLQRELEQEMTDRKRTVQELTETRCRWNLLCDEHRDLEREHKEARGQIQHLEESNRGHLSTIGLLQERLSQQQVEGQRLQETVNRLEEEKEQQYNLVEKLQTNNAKLVVEMSKNVRMLKKEKDERAAQVAVYREELKKAAQCHGEVKERLHKEHKLGGELTAKLRDASDECTRLRAQVRELERQNTEQAAAHVREKQEMDRQTQLVKAEIAHSKQSFQELEEAYKQKVAGLKAALAQRDESAKQQRQELLLKLEEASRELQGREEYWAARHARLEDQLRKKFLTSEPDATAQLAAAQQRVAQLEAQVRQLEKFSKPSFLRDRTNIGGVGVGGGVGGIGGGHSSSEQQAFQSLAQTASAGVPIKPFQQRSKARATSAMEDKENFNAIM